MEFDLYRGNIKGYIVGTCRNTRTNKIRVRVMKSVLNIEVSCFKDYSTPNDPRNVNLLHWLRSQKYQNEVNRIRIEQDPEVRKQLKSKLPGITPSGLFTHRKQDSLITHSGLIQFDIDLTEENKLITNWNDLKSELSKIPNIAYIGLSVSGRGYWGLIPIPKEPENHKRYFEAIHEAFIKIGIKLDSAPQNPASLRGYSYDSTAYYNHEAKLFKTFLPKPVPVQKPNYTTSNTNKSNEGLENWFINELRKAPEGQRHLTRLKLSRLAGGLISSGNLDFSIEQKLIEAYLLDYAAIDNPHTQSKEINAIKSGIKDGLNFPVHTKESNQKSYSYNKFYSKPLVSSYSNKPVCKRKSFAEYINELRFENGILINGDNYPADWDTVENHDIIDLKTKQFVSMAIKNPNLLIIQQRFNLTRN